MKLLPLVISTLIATSFSFGAEAITRGSKVPTKASVTSKQVSKNMTAPMSATERQQLAAKIINQWSAYVQQVYGTTPQAWAKAMVGTFASADPVNFRQAVTRTTFEGAMAELLGRGQQTSDEEIINTLAKSSNNAEKLGDLAEDLVYTMITPCRLIDTRNVGGLLTADTARNFVGSNPTVGFATAQGGSSTDCAIPADPAAVVMNVTIVDPAAQGYVTVYPYLASLPTASSINYLTGEIKANELIVKQTQLDTFDFSIYTTTATHVVVDAVGYFIAPEATALDCQNGAPGGGTISAGADSAAVATCAIDYNVTGGACTATVGTTPLTSFGTAANSALGSPGFWSCTFRNTTASSGVTAATAMCCRVPGR